VATKQYVDASGASLWQNIRYCNRIINGDMSVDQRNGGATIAATNAYAMDRWKFAAGSMPSASGRIGQAPNGAQSAAFPFPYVLRFAAQAVYTPVAADVVIFYQGIEGCNFNNALWGTANAQPVTLEFSIYASAAGTYAGSLQNAAQNRSYVFTFAVTTAGVWQKFRVSIPGDTAGTWTVANNVAAAYLSFNIGTGATGQTATPNAWVAGNYLSTPSAVNTCVTNGAQLLITGVALMVGAAAANAEPEFRKYSDNLIDCQRYFFTGQAAWQGYATASQGIYQTYFFPVRMRANPAGVVVTNNSLNLTAAPGFAGSTPAGVGITVTGTPSATGLTTVNCTFTADVDF
jgi:hypothetical protein